MTETLLLSTSATAILSFGFFLGLKHATEADHLAAVSTIVSSHKNLFSSVIVGGLWGLGHTASLFAAGMLVLLLDIQINERTERILEFLVGIMLVFLGVNVLRRILKGGKLHIHTHEHGEHSHVHPHIHEEGHEDEPHTHHGFSFTPRAILIGAVHGLAGSAALMLMIIPTIESTLMSILYILIFGVGSIGGMMIMSLIVGLPFHLSSSHLNRFNFILQSVAGLVSVGLGLLIIYEKGVVEGLFV